MLWYVIECGGQSCNPPAILYASLFIDIALWSVLVFVVVSLFMRIRKWNAKKK
jgi:hypothetical protein